MRSAAELAYRRTATFRRASARRAWRTAAKVTGLIFLALIVGAWLAKGH